MMLKHTLDKDPALSQMCRLVIRDETGHIEFHKDRIARSGKKFGPLWAGLFKLMGITAGTMLCVNHGKAIRSIGGENSEFYKEISKAIDYFITTLSKVFVV